MQSGQRARRQELIGQRHRHDLPAEPRRTAAAATVSNRPPTMVWFSHVTTRRSESTSASTVSVSKGLSVGVCTTAVSTWCVASSAAACRARIVISPLEISTTSAPPRSTLALPNSKV